MAINWGHYLLWNMNTNIYTIVVKIYNDDGMGVLLWPCYNLVVYIIYYTMLYSDWSGAEPVI